MGEPKLRLQGVSQVYEGARGETRALQNMDIDVAPGEAVAILGPSGCGKSTSLLIAAGLRVPTQGAAFVDGVRVAGPRLNTALILQDFGLLPWKTVAERVTGYVLKRLHGLPQKTGSTAFLQPCSSALTRIMNY